MVRDEKVIIRLAPHIKGRVQEIAEEMGVTMSGYIAHVIGSHVVTNDAMTRGLPEQIRGVLVESMKDVIKEAQGANDLGAKGANA